MNGEEKASAKLNFSVSKKVSAIHIALTLVAEKLSVEIYDKEAFSTIWISCFCSCSLRLKLIAVS